MSFGHPAPDSEQPVEFAFTEENLKRARTIIARYPAGKQQSALLPLLDLAQRQHDNWLPRAAMEYVADFLEVPRIRAYEVASFYTMFNKAPVGRHLIQVCTTTPCWLCGSSDILKAIADTTGLKPGQDGADGAFSVVEVECLGACVNAPMVQINDDYYEDLDYDRMCRIIDDLKAGRTVEAGSQTGRRGAQAQAGPTSLLDRAPKDVKAAAKKDAKSGARKGKSHAEG
ncbi:MAG: NADH-quinone oxidoreductase subunit NuoE [Azospirillaceae bacterium]